MDPLIPVLGVFALSLVFAVMVMGWREQWRANEVREDGDGPVCAPMCAALIIPARNAASELVPLLQDLYAQTNPGSDTEFIVVNDHSEDGTAGVVEGMMQQWRALQLILNEGIGKKAAISTGVSRTRAEVIILTDADGACGPDRVRVVLEKMRKDQLDLLLLPIRVQSDGSLLQGIQEMEQNGFVGAAAAEAFLGRPSLSHGANMAFRRDAFEKVDGYAGDQRASGDDMFLVQRMRKAGLRIGYLVDERVVVTVAPARTWNEFLHQRIRWAGKMGAVQGALPWIGAGALLLPWILLVVTLLVDIPEMEAGHRVETAAVLLFAWVLWLYPVPYLVAAVRATFRQPPSKAMALFAFVAFTFYTPVIALIALFKRPVWKGRVVKK